MFEANPPSSLAESRDVSSVERNDSGAPRSGRQAAEVIRCLSPATGELIGEVPVLGDREVGAIVRRARAAQTAWARRSVKERAQQLLAFRDALVRRADELAELLAREAGKPRHEGLIHEVLVVAELISYYAEQAPRLLAPERRRLRVFRYRRSEVRYEPRGVVAVIGPWNFPLQLPLRDAVAAWMAGNAVVVKPSEEAPLSLLRAKEIWDDAKLPADLFGVVTGFGATGAALVDAGVDFVAFTGSVETGRRVAAACGERLIPCLMELGGKAPAVVCEDADVERAAQAIVLGGFANSGQVCVSVERVYAHRAVYERLVERIVALTLDLEQGDPATRFVDVGAMTFARQLEIVERHVADAIAHGARVRCGGKRVAGSPQAFEPTVIVDCHPGCSVMNEEIFGPVVPIMSVDSEAEAVRLANDSRLGLNAYVFTESAARGRAIAERLQAGSVLVNDVLSNAAMPEVPFGGIKQSGFGRAMGPEGLRAMCHVKHVSHERIKPPARHPLAYPYTEDKYRWILRGMRLLYDGGSGLAGKVLRRVTGLG